MEESEIVKFICANQGAVNTHELLCNVCCDGSTDALSNRDKFAPCCVNGQPIMLARTRLRLCRKSECPWTCGRLHLCVNFLYSGCCPRRVCSFSHELDSAYNAGILKQHELESLSRAELCTLLLQSDCTILPPICHDYNNKGDGEFGRCKDGNDCKRLHICERYLSYDCRCFRTHDFHAPQPLKVLQSKGVPDTLMSSLKTIYINIEAIRISDNISDNHRKCKPRSSTSDASAADNLSDTSSDSGLNLSQTEWYRGKGGHLGSRGNSGTRGNRRYRGDRMNQQQRSSSTSDILACIDDLDLYTVDGLGEQQEPTSTTSDLSNDGNNDSSDSGQNRSGQQYSNKTARGRGGRQGNRGKRGNRGNGGNRGERSNIGHRGNRGNYSNLKERASSTSDFHASTGLGLCPKDSLSEESSKQKVTNPTVDPTDASNNDSTMPDANDNRPKRRQRPVREKTEICLFFIKGHCIHDDEKCFKVHDKMPYRWEVREGNQWTALPDNETIERDYCDPKKSESCSTPPVHFDTMTCGQNNVRRLSTSNCLVEPTFMYTTEWIWYWQDDSGKWNTYASSAGGHASDIDSTKLEQKFLINDKDVVEFTAGSQSYSLSFQDMKQTNKQYGTERHVRRRPHFVSVADVITKRVRRPKDQPRFCTVPGHWDQMQLPETGFRRVSLKSSSDEFKEIESMFCKTMRGFDIVSIERIQNKSLWEVFQWQKNQMKNRNGGKYVKERKLFHGTDSKHVDAICLTNFDWRICGTHGTAYGKGSYFARDAKYSHSYTSDTAVKSMFVSHVLVGDYTRGSSGYCRPPSKDGGDVNFYDSCVDDVCSPSIFVVFEKHQIYPEYLLQYRTLTQPSTYAYTHSVSAQPSTSAFTHSVSAQPSTSAFTHSVSAQPSTSAFTHSVSAKPSTSAFTHSVSAQPSTLVYKPSTGTYRYQPSKPSTSPAQTPVFPPPSTPKKKSDSCVIA